jgi:hypothetical protein
MLDPLFKRAGELHRDLIQWIDTNPDLAAARAEFTAAQLSRSPQLDAAQRKLFNYRFAVEGIVKDRSVLEMYLATRSNLTDADRSLVASWQRGFMALLAIVAIYPNGLEVMNWVTAKHYRIQFADTESLQAIARLKVEEIVLAQIIPIRGIDWLIASPWISLGKLGKPKLAVAIGSFRQNYPHYLYPDAPELLAAAWDSVTAYHDRFVAFFGTDELTLTGAQMERQMAEFQTQTIDRQLASAGVDKTKSLAELAADAGVEVANVSDLTATLGVPGSDVPAISSQPLGKMVEPSLEFPPHLKQARQVTALSDRYWGQMMLTQYTAIADLLDRSADRVFTNPEIDLFKKCLADPQMNSYIWRKLSDKYPQQFTIAIRQIPEFSDFNLSTDIDRLLTKFNKFLEPDLPDIASVPIHLHQLFESALKQVSKDKAKAKQPPKKGGFGAKS